jgi:hypothetical protein
MARGGKRGATALMRGQYGRWTTKHENGRGVRTKNHRLIGMNMKRLGWGKEVRSRRQCGQIMRRGGSRTHGCTGRAYPSYGSAWFSVYEPKHP